MALSDSPSFSRTNLREWAATQDVILRRIKDHVFSHSPAVAILFGQRLVEDSGSIPQSGQGHQTQVGGHSIQIRVRLGSHSGTKVGAGPYDTHNTTPDDNTRLGQAVWKFYTNGLAVAEHELRINRGDAAIANFLEEQTQEVMLSVVDTVAGHIYTDGGANAINELSALISANSTIQGLAGGTYANFNARGLSARGTAASSVSFTSGSFSVQGISDLRTLFNNGSEGLIQPHVTLTDYATAERYEGALQPQQRYTGDFSTADARFTALAFSGKPFLADPKCDSGALYMLRLGETGVVGKSLSGADFEYGEWKPSQNQNVMVRPFEATIATCIGNRRYGCNRMASITD